MTTTTGPRTCAIHGDDTRNGRCQTCDHLASFNWASRSVDAPNDPPLPRDLAVRRLIGRVPVFTTKQNSHAAPWGDLLEWLPTISSTQDADLKVQTRDLRVWLSRCTTADGEPFDRTVYVEALRGGRWIDLGYFDGDEDDPHPLGTLGDGWNATYRRLGVEIS